MRRIASALVAAALGLSFAIQVPASEPVQGASRASSSAPTIARRTAGLQRTPGFVPFYWDAGAGKVLIEVPAFDEDVLYYVSAASGGGSVELPFDRGIMASSVVHFQRSGPRVLVVEQNLRYRALDSEVHAQNVKRSFPTSVLASLPVEAEEGGRVLVDATSLFMRDAADISADARRANQGTFRFDAARSGFHPPRMKGFPDNTEIETVATFSVDNPGVVVNRVAPNPLTVSFYVHHSFLRAPTGYTPRKADPRIGIGALEFRDYGKPADESTEVKWISRWRLEKKDPGAAISEPKKPIVFYLDPAIPEPFRSAMREGTLWWNQAFEAAGFRNAVQVADPTPDMDPMDIRYAWVLWIERDERGFSSGGTFRDPRTGEILGSKTRMDSHRLRTIANYWEAYMPSTVTADGKTPEGLKNMTTLRQSLLVAHELGHALGFGHNFASSLNERASVMEYPTPRVKVVDGKLDLSESFMTGIGAYDTFMVRFAYTPLPAADEASGLEKIVAEMRQKGILYVPSTDPRWTWYDDRATPTEYLRETLAARKIMLSQYGPSLLKTGEPIGALRDMRLWMTYLHHRWAIEAGQGYIGGMFHEYAVKGEKITPTKIVPGSTQREVLGLLMQAIEPANLDLPEELLEQLTPHPGSNLEDLADDYAFDHLRAARILAAMVIEPLVDPKRAARLVAFSDRDPGNLSLPELVETLVAKTWGTQDDDPHARALRRVTQRVVLDGLMMLGGDPDTTPEARAYVLDRLTTLGHDIGSRKDKDPLTAAHFRQAARDISWYLEDPRARAPKSISVPWGERPRSRYPQPPGPPL